MTCVETTACTPVGACVDRPSFCYPRALLAKALQEGRVEAQIFNALTPSQTKTSYTCQLDECATSQDPQNICKVMGGVNYEVRKSTDPKSETATITKYMYVCICGPDWEAGPNHRNCRKRDGERYGSDSMGDGSGGMNFFSRPPESSYGGYGFAYGPSYGLSPFGAYQMPANPYQEPPDPPKGYPPYTRLVSSPSGKFPRLIQFEYGTNPTPSNGNGTNSTNSSNASTPMPPPNPRPPGYPVPPGYPIGYPSGYPGLSGFPGPHVAPGHAPHAIPEEPISDGILVSGGDDAEPADYNNDDEYGAYKRGEIIIPSEEYPRNRTTLASLIPSVDDGDEDGDDDKGTRGKKPPKKKWPGPGRWKRNDTRIEPDEVPLAPTTRPPTSSGAVSPQTNVNIPVMVPLTTLESAGARLAFLEYLVYSVIGCCVLAALGALIYYLYQRRATKKSRMLSPIPFVMNEMDPEYSKNSEGNMYPLDVPCDDWDTVSKKACEDAWAKLGGLPGKGMSQVVIYYGTPYASVVRSQDNAQSITEDCRDSVVVDVTLTPEERQSVNSESSCQTRAKFRYVLRRDNSQSSRRSGSLSTNMSLVSTTGCSTSDSAAEY